MECRETAGVGRAAERSSSTGTRQGDPVVQTVKAEQTGNVVQERSRTRHLVVAALHDRQRRLRVHVHH